MRTILRNKLRNKTWSFSSTPVIPDGSDLTLLAGGWQIGIDVSIVQPAVKTSSDGERGPREE